MHKKRFLYIRFFCYSSLSHSLALCLDVTLLFHSFGCLSIGFVFFSVRFVLFLFHHFVYGSFNNSYFYLFHAFDVYSRYTQANIVREAICCRFVSEICWKVLNMHKNSHGLNSNNCEIFNVVFFPSHKKKNHSLLIHCDITFGKFFFSLPVLLFNRSKDIIQ